MRTARKLLLTIVTVSALAALAYAAMRTPQRWAYRDQPASSPACRFLHDHPTALRVDADGQDNIESAMPNEAWKCMLQTHVDAPPVGFFRGVRSPGQSTAYTLAFIELDEDGRQIDARQFAALERQLLAQKQNYLITYLHGWRHDARRDDGDVRRFRMLLAYAKSFLDLRCRTTGRYCEATVTGAYIGWRGQELATDDGGIVMTALVAPTLLTRKRVSERVAAPAVAMLKTLSEETRARNTSRGDFYQKDKMLVLGHSLGGNVLATGLHDLILETLDARKAGEIFQAPLGDLVVLFNPAAEAWKWTDIQKKVLQARKATAGRGDRNFDPNQRPVYVAATSACFFPEAEAKARDLQGRHIACDEATGRLFPIFKTLTFDWARDHRTTIGHLYPKGEGDDALLGQTHDLDINGSLHEASSYNRASNPVYSQCRVADGWLTLAKARHTGPGWDAGSAASIDPADPNLALDPINDSVHYDVPWFALDADQVRFERDLRVNAQFRHGIARGIGPSITEPDDPFWNVRALDTAVADHGGFFGFATWCAFNQLVLDDVTAKLTTSMTDIWKDPAGKAAHALSSESVGEIFRIHP